MDMVAKATLQSDERFPPIMVARFILSLVVSLGVSLGVSLVGVAGAFAQSVQVQPGQITIRNVNVNILRTPDYQFRGDQKRVPNAQNWIEIEVEFDSAVPFIPELTFDYFVALDVRTTQVVLVGQVTHVSVVQGASRFSSMYIAPQTISAVLQGRSTFRPNIVDQATVQITHQGTPIAEGSANRSPAPPWWTDLQQLSGFLWNKNDTPFAPLWWDRYEAIKPGSR